MQIRNDLQVPCCIKGRYVIRFTVTSQRTTAQVQFRAGKGISHFTSLQFYPAKMIDLLN